MLSKHPVSPIPTPCRPLSPSFCTTSSFPTSPPLFSLPLPSLYHPLLPPSLSLTLLSLPPPPLALPQSFLRLSSHSRRLWSWPHWPLGQSSQGRNPLPIPTHLPTISSISPSSPLFEFQGSPTGCGASLLASQKKSGHLRPIAVVEVLLWLVSKCIAAFVTHQVKSISASPIWCLFT